MAPLADISTGFPASATVYRYTITFEAVLKAPTTGEQDRAASAEEFDS